MLLNVPGANRVAAHMMSGLDIDYGGAGHVGGRLPDFKVDKGWASRLFHKARVSCWPATKNTSPPLRPTGIGSPPR